MCSVYERAFRSLRENQPDAKEEAVMLLEAWRAFEADTAAAEQRQVSACPPKFACLHVLFVYWACKHDSDSKHCLPFSRESA